MAERKSMMLYYDAIPQWEMLSDDQRGKLLLALLYYGKEGVEPDIEDGMIMLAFSFFKAQLDRDSEKYEKKCEKNAENIRKRWNKNDTNVYEGIPNETKNTDTDTDKHKDIDSGREKDRDTKENAVAYGSYVTLTQQEYNDLVSNYGRSVTEDYINRVNGFCSRSGKTYKNYFSTIQEWMCKDGVEKFDSSKYDFFINRFPDLSQNSISPS